MTVDIDSKNPVEQLSMGLLCLDMARTAEEPQEFVIDQSTAEPRLIKRQWQYVEEILRVLKELRLTINLIEGPPDEAYLQKVGSCLEDFLMHQQGHFLSLTYQMREKICQLINLLTLDAIPEKVRSKEDATLKSLLKRPLLETIGIVELMKIWEGIDAKSGICAALRRRTDYEHYVNPLNLHPNLVSLRSAKTMLKTAAPFLSEKAKEIFSRMEIDSSEKLHQDILSKVRSTYSEIEINVNEIAKKLILHFSIPNTAEEVAEKIKIHTDMLESLDIKNATDPSKVPDLYKPVVKRAVDNILKTHTSVKYIFLIGSLPRGEFDADFSDINFVVVEDCEEEVYMSEIASLKGIPNFIQIMRINLSSFLSDKLRAQKMRFLCKLDGFQVYGEDFTSKEHFPKPGIRLSRILSSDLEDYMDTFEEWLKTGGTDESSCLIMSRDLVKHLIDFIFYIRLANTAGFTFSKKERLALLKEESPGDGKVENLLEQILLSEGCPRKGDIQGFYEIFKPTLTANLKKIAEVVAKLDTRDASTARQ